MEKRIREKLKTAMRYPATVVAAIAIAIAVITLFVLPKFAPIFESLGDNLPWSTRILLGVSGFFSSYWYVLAAIAAAGLAGIRLYLKNPDGRYRFDKYRLRLPVVGPITLKASMARICRSLALALDSGVPAVHASPARPATSI